MRAFSLDLRERVLAAVDAGGRTHAQVAETFDVSLAFVRKLVQQRRHTGSIAPVTGKSGRKRLLSDHDRERLRELVAERPGLTLEVMKAELGLDCCAVTVWNELKRMGISHKKTTAGGRA